MIPKDTVSIETAKELAKHGITRTMREGDWVLDRLWDDVGLVTKIEGSLVKVKFSRVDTTMDTGELILLPRHADITEMLGGKEGLEAMALHLLESRRRASGSGVAA
jgi:hypothetical protein